MRRRVLLVAVICLLPIHVESYEIGTHEDMVSAAARRSASDGVLKDDLGLGPGLLAKVRGKTLEDWLIQGGTNEDDFPRFLNHFHNPLATTWSQAGLGGSVGQSAVLWAQNPGQSAPSWSWQDARQSYLHALTKASGADRENSHAATFAPLGPPMPLSPPTPPPPPPPTTPPL